MKSNLDEFARKVERVPIFTREKIAAGVVSLTTLGLLAYGLVHSKLHNSNNVYASQETSCPMPTSTLPKLDL